MELAKIVYEGSIKNLEAMVDAYAKLMGEFVMHISPSGVFITEVDAAHVAMVETKMAPELFYEFQIYATTEDIKKKYPKYIDDYNLKKLKSQGVETSQLVSIIVDLDELKRVLTMARKMKRLTLEITDTTITYTMEDDRHKKKFTKETALFEQVKNQVAIRPTIKRPMCNESKPFKLPSDLVLEFIKSSAKMTDDIWIIYEPNDGKPEITFKTDTPEEDGVLAIALPVEQKYKEEMKSKYPLDYIYKSVTNILKSTKEFTLCYDTNFPLELRGDIEGIHVAFLLAPKTVE